MRLRSSLTSSLALVFGLALAAPLATPATAAGIGVVLLHARNSLPSQFDAMLPRLEAAGYAGIGVNACWSARRTYGGTPSECQVDIDNAIAALKARGMDRFVIAGNDYGGMYALYYAASHPQIAGVVAWGPRANIRAANDETLQMALKLQKSGDGGKKGGLNDGRTTTANQFIAWEGADGPFVDPEALLRKVSVPVLWMAANDDLGPRDPSARFKLIKASPLNNLVWSVSDQSSMVDVSLAEVIAWLGKVKAAP